MLLVCVRGVALGALASLHLNVCVCVCVCVCSGDGELVGVKDAIRRGRMLKCKVCGEKGATLGCFLRTCRCSFHLPCARRNKNVIQMDPYYVACPEHFGNPGDRGPTPGAEGPQQAQQQQAQQQQAQQQQAQQREQQQRAPAVSMRPASQSVPASSTLFPRPPIHSGSSPAAAPHAALRGSSKPTGIAWDQQGDSHLQPSSPGVLGRAAVAPAKQAAMAAAGPTRVPPVGGTVAAAAAGGRLPLGIVDGGDGKAVAIEPLPLDSKWLMDTVGGELMQKCVSVWWGGVGLASGTGLQPVAACIHFFAA